MGELVCPEQLAPTVIGELVLPVEVGTSSRTLRCVCPNCQATIKAKAYRAGTTVNCPQCKIPFDIPISSADQFEVGSQPLRPAHKLFWLRPVGAAVISLVVVIVVAFVLWKITLAPPSFGDDLKYVPEDCHVLASFNVQELIGSDQYKELRREVPAIEKQFEESNGIPLSKVKRVTLGATFFDGSDAAFIYKMNAPVTASDIRSGKKVWEYKKNFRYEEVQVGKHTIYVETYDNDFIKGFEHNRPAFALPDDKTVLRGSTIMLQKILKRDKKASISEAMKSGLKDVNFARSLVIVMDVRAARSQPDFEKAKAELNEFPGIHDLLDSSDSLALEASLGPRIMVNGTLVCKNSKSAEENQRILGGALVTLKKRVQEQRGVLREFADVLGDMKLSTGGAKVTASATCQSERLIKAIREADQAPSPKSK
jgi:hypothetical protein